MTDNMEDEEKLAEALAAILIDDDWTIINTDNYIGFGLIWDGKAFIISVLAAQLQES